MSAIAAARKEAIAYYERIRALPYPVEVMPSSLWHHDLVERHEKLMASPDHSSVLDAMQADNLFSFGRRTDDPLYRQVIDGYKDYLGGRSGLLYDDPRLQETPLCPPSSCSIEGAKTLSGMFLWFLCTYESITRYIRSPLALVLEIGGGYGGLARLVKLGMPNVTCCIVDLHPCLYFSLFFLKAHFPDARFCTIDSREAFAEAMADPGRFDFIFVPISLVDGFSTLQPRLHVDLVINTASFGEMTQAAVDRYFRLIQTEIDVAFLYSHNRFGCPEMLPEYTTPLDPYWQVLAWKRHGLDTFTHIEPVTPSSLEVVVRRVPRESAPDDRLQSRSREHLALARQPTSAAGNASDGEYHLWESVRLWPDAENMKAWCDHLRRGCLAELAYFEKASARIGISPTDVAQHVGMTSCVDLRLFQPVSGQIHVDAHRHLMLETAPASRSIAAALPLRDVGRLADIHDGRADDADWLAITARVLEGEVSFGFVDSRGQLQTRCRFGEASLLKTVWLDMRRAYVLDTFVIVNGPILPFTSRLEIVSVMLGWNAPDPPAAPRDRPTESVGT